MECLKCSGPTGVIDSRPSLPSIRRRRECLDCKHRFSTYEITAEEKESIDKILTAAKKLLD